eukprot:TRINITY_DN9184_c0_g1_i2.p1 TRINITY_DN9184_c0_g1~~TRINITY_DN9184_c0_g1_i2.p1  ORF type:complete len:716 (-),score=118.18 TRINITY_DN9184_c0_g1_i2:261-2408(-)
MAAVAVGDGGPVPALSPRDVETEMDLPELRRRLQLLGRRVESSQSRVLATVGAKHAEFVATHAQIGEVGEHVQSLHNGLARLVHLLKDDGVGTAGAAPEGAIQPLPALRSAVSEHARVHGDLAAIDSAEEVLTTLLSVKGELQKLDEFCAAAHFEDAAKLTVDVARRLQCISAPISAEEPAIVRTTKTQYYQRRGALTTRLEDALGRLVTFDEHRSVSLRTDNANDTGTATKPATLRQVWNALHVLEVRDRRVDQLGEQALRLLLRPLLEVARKLPRGRRLQPKVTEQAICTWTWVEVSHDVDEAGFGERSKPLAQAVIPVLESLFDFAYERWAAGIHEVYASLGHHLWPAVTRALTQHFDTFGGDGGAALERFEAAMLSKGLIGAKEKTLSRHVYEHHREETERRRTETLAEVRAWLVQDDTGLVAVSDDTEPGCMTELLKREGTARGAALSETLRQAAENDEGLLRLPAMRISTSAHKIAVRVRELLGEAVEVAKHGQLEAAKELGRLAREVVVLVMVLRPFSQKAQLRSSPRCGAVFLADCLYLAHVLVMLPYSHGRDFPPELQEAAFLVDLVPQLRRVGESHFMALLQGLQERLATSLEPCTFEITRSHSFVGAEAALGAAVQQLKLAAQGLAEALPAQLLQEVVGMLIGVFCAQLLGKLFRLKGASPEEVCNISALLTSALAMARPVFVLVNHGEVNDFSDIGKVDATLA